MITLTIQNKNDYTLINCNTRKNILEQLIEYGYPFDNVCGGMGTCGKCKIRVINGTLPITSADLAQLGKKETSEGFRLACQAYPDSDCTIELHMQKRQGHQIISSYSEGKDSPKQAINCHASETSNQTYGIAVDIGTTTVVLQLIGLWNPTEFTTSAANFVIDNITIMNPQRAFGFDVISRIQSANEGNLSHMQDLISNSLSSSVLTLLRKNGLVPEQLTRFTIAGNTTMIHILMGYPCDTLGKAPYRPYFTGSIRTDFKHLFCQNRDELPDIKVDIFSSISAFVGGDIVSGLLFCEFDKRDGIHLFIDLGTNGEMAIGSNDRILVTSTAAGPAFEGGNLSCGTGSVNGAICSVEITEGELNYHTIGDAAPIGFCGTGALELTAELLKNHIMDETGCLIDAYFETGYHIPVQNLDGMSEPIILTQKDIRELQLAKAAIRAGIEILLLRYGCRYEDIDTVFLAGGFGYYLNVEKAAEIGLLPRELVPKVKAVGNSSLGGGAYSMIITDTTERTEKIISASSEINLSADGAFYDLYVEQMMF